MTYDAKTIEEAHKGKKMLKTVLVVNAIFTAFYILRIISYFFNSAAGPLQAWLGNPMVWFSWATTIAALALSMPTYRGKIWAKNVLSLIVITEIIRSFINFPGLLYIGVEYGSFIIFTFIFIWTLLISKRTKLYFKLINENALTSSVESMIDEIGKE